jgi:hypothetical protein
MLKSKSWPGAGGSCLNPSYLGGWDQEDQGLRPTWTKSSQDPISKITKMEVWLEHLFASTNPLFKPQPHPKKKKKKKKLFRGWRMY